MPENYDAFGDIREEAAGIFDAEQAALQPGLKRHQAVHDQTTKSGVMLQFECQVCGQPSVFEAEYPEIVAIKYGVNPVVAFHGRQGILQNPTRWEFLPEKNGWKPEARCGSCHAFIDALIEPHEPEKFLQSARRRGFINPEGESQVSQICAQAAQAGQSARR